MFVTVATEVCFFASGEEFRRLVANLLSSMQDYARTWNALGMETTVVVDRVMRIERSRDAIRYKMYFNTQEASVYRIRDIVADFVDAFLQEMFPNAWHTTYAVKVFRR